MAISAASEERVAAIRNGMWYGLLLVLTVWFAFIPAFGGNLPFFFYLMLWITMASAFNIISGFTGYMPFGYVAFYGIGAFTTAFMLAAKALGVDTIAQAAVASYAGFVRRHFDIPEDQHVICAISFGYGDPDHPANSYRTPRADVSDVLDWRA